MKDFLKSIRFKVLIGIAALLAGFMLYAISTGQAATIMEQGLDFIITPIQTASTAISNSISTFFARFLNTGEVYDENERLKEEIRELQEKLADYDQYKLQNDQLKEFLQLKELNPDFELEPATVTGRDVNDRLISFTINRGHLHGIEAGDPVITKDGLVGIVDRVSAISARVNTVLHLSVKPRAMISSTGDVGVIANTTELSGEGKLCLTMIDRDTKAKPGDLVLTSGTTGVFPQGLIIGTIDEILLDPNGLSMNLTIQPIAEMDDIKDVVVIKSFLGQGDNVEIPIE